jgi:hypothetical protein
MPTSAKTTSADLAEQLSNSHSTTIYVDADFNDADAAALLKADPPLRAEFDVVRGLWAIRRATDDEVLVVAPPAEPAQPVLGQPNPVAEAADAAEEVQTHAQQRRSGRSD